MLILVQATYLVVFDDTHSPPPTRVMIWGLFFWMSSPCLGLLFTPSPSILSFFDVAVATLAPLL